MLQQRGKCKCGKSLLILAKILLDLVVESIIMVAKQTVGVHKSNMKTVKSLILLSTLLSFGPGFGAAQNAELHWTSPVKERYVTFYAEPKGQPPDEMAVWIETDAIAAELKKSEQDWFAGLRTNHTSTPTRMPSLSDLRDKVTWVPFKTNVLVDFGPGDGARWLFVGFRNKNEGNSRWDAVHHVSISLWGTGHYIVVQSSPPVIVITDPKDRITSQPMIQLKGFVSTDLEHPLYYQVFDQKGVVTASGEGGVNDKYYDPILSVPTTNYFSCLDLQLSEGTNTIALHGTDSAGFSFATNFVCVFTTMGDTNPPVFSIDSPRPGQVANADSMTIRGPIDDPTAKMVGQILAKGQTNNIEALIERNGYFWFENLPLALGPNYVSLTATDVAGNSSSTNFVIYGANDFRVSMDPVNPDSQLWQSTIAVVTGHVHPANHNVWINGIQASVKPDGTWLAKNVPVVSSPSGGTALFDLTTISLGDMAKGNVKINEQVSAQASLGTNAMILNASSPACGVFQLHLTGTAGHSFVLQASTNLVKWMPILTNLNPNASFDYTDTNAINYRCRFFRVVPLQ